MTHSLVLRNVSKSFGGKLVLNDWSCEFDAGTYLLTGKNGSGKTTILNLIAGTLAPDSGSIEIQGRAARVGKERVFLAPAYSPAIPWMTGDTFLSFVASLFPKTARDDAFRDHVVERFNISGFVAKPLAQMSAGTAKKMVLTAAFLANPEILLFDEPTNELDQESRRAFVELLESVAPGRTVIIVTHLDDVFYSLFPKTVSLGPSEGQERASTQT